MNEEEAANRLMEMIDLMVEDKGLCPFELLAQLVKRLHDRVELEYIVYLCMNIIEPKPDRPTKQTNPKLN